MDAIRVWQALKKRTHEASSLPKSQHDLSKLITIKNSLSNDSRRSQFEGGVFSSTIEGSSEIDEPFPNSEKYVFTDLLCILH
jgi:hypothetical protein